MLFLGGLDCWHLGKAYFMRFFTQTKRENMASHPQSGQAVRELSMLIVIDFMQATSACHPGGGGMTQTDLFSSCGFDWGDQPSYTSSSQQMWFCALLKVLEQNKKIRQLPNKKWELF
jgi:hypothetical protein